MEKQFNLAHISIKNKENIFFFNVFNHQVYCSELDDTLFPK